MPLKVISDKHPNPENNAAQTEAIIALISRFVGGKELLDEALRDGDITIHCTENMAQFGARCKDDSAHWDAKNRKINVYSGQQQTNKTLYQLGTAILFGLCNATNKQLNAKEKQLPLSFPSQNAYAKYMESLEFISFQRNTAILNATCKREGIPAEELCKEYTDFELYWDEVANAPRQGVNGNTVVHADIYREVFISSFNFIKKEIVSLPQIRPYSKLKGISVESDSMQMITEAILNLSINNCATSELLTIKAMLCPQLQDILEVNTLLSILVPESYRLAQLVMQMVSAFPQILLRNDCYNVLRTALSDQSKLLIEAGPLLVELATKSDKDDSITTNRHSIFSTVKKFFEMLEGPIVANPSPKQSTSCP